MTGRIKGLLFDKDGVIIDFERTWGPALMALAERLASGDAGLRAELLARSGLDTETGTFRSGSVWAAGNAHDLAAVWLDLTPYETSDQLVGDLDRHCAAWPQTGIIEAATLRQLMLDLRSAGYFIGLATNDSELSARRALDALAVDDLFECVLGYDSVARSKPAPDPVLRFCDVCGLVPGEVAMIGDNSHDMEMAQAARTGLAIAVLSGNSRHGDIAHLADRVIDDIAALPALLRQLNEV